MSMQLLMVRLRDLIEPRGSSTLPSAADEKTVTGAAGAWAAGSWVELASTVGDDDILIFSVNIVSITGIHELEIGTGAAASEVSLAKLAISTTGVHEIRVPQIAGGTRLAARTASKAGGAQALTCKVNYIALS